MGRELVYEIRDGLRLVRARPPIAGKRDAYFVAVMSDEFAAGTKFKRRIAHGLLTASLISAALGTKVPGPGAIYVSQNLKFTAPVYLGDVVTATVTLVALDSLHRYVRFDCVCRVGHKMVLSGDAVLYVPNRPAELAA